MAGIYEGKVALAAKLVLTEVVKGKNETLKKVLAQCITLVGNAAKELDKAMDNRDGSAIDKSVEKLKAAVEKSKGGIDTVIKANLWPAPVDQSEINQISIEKQMLGAFKNRLTYIGEDTQDAKGALMNGPLESLAGKELFGKIEAPLKTTEKLIKGFTKSGDAPLNPVSGKKDGELVSAVQNVKSAYDSVTDAIGAMTGQKKKSMNMAQARTLLISQVSDVLSGLKQVEDGCSHWIDHSARLAGDGKSLKDKKVFDNLVKIVRELKEAAHKDQDPFAAMEKTVEKLGRASA
jgi:hypothetical protein